MSNWSASMGRIGRWLLSRGPHTVLRFKFLTANLWHTTRRWKNKSSVINAKLEYFQVLSNNQTFQRKKNILVNVY